MPLRQWQEVQSLPYAAGPRGLTHSRVQHRNGILRTYLLNLIYALVLLVGLPVLVYRAIRLGKNRRGWAQRLWGSVPSRANAGINKKCIWFHAVSVGEINLLSTVLKDLETQLPDWHFAISTTTETGYDLAVRLYGEHQVFFCPIDFSWAVNRVLDRLDPALVVLAELELWPNIVQQVDRRGIPTAIINGRLSEKSFSGYRKVKFLMRDILSKVDLIAVQTQKYADRFQSLGADKSTVRVTGSVKFDGANFDPENSFTQSLAKLAGLKKDDFVFVAGSTQPNEDRIAIDTWKQFRDQRQPTKLIIVPRHLHQLEKTTSYLQANGIEYTLRSELRPDKLAAATEVATKAETEAKPVFIVDVIGELGGWWGCADVAYVGGSMCRRGGQNMIEPAAFGVPTCFGPNTKNFREVTELLLEQDAAQVVHDGPELTQFIKQVIENPEMAARMGKAAQQIVMQQQGASSSTVSHVLRLLGMQCNQPDAKVAKILSSDSNDSKAA